MRTLKEQYLSRIEQLLSQASDLVNYGRANSGKTDDHNGYKLMLWIDRVIELSDKLFQESEYRIEVIKDRTTKIKSAGIHSNSYQIILDVKAILENAKADLV